MRKNHFIWFLFFLTAINLVNAGGFPKTVIGSPTCRDENNNPVDWFIAYKLPMKTLNTDLMNNLKTFYNSKKDDPINEETYKQLSDKNDLKQKEYREWGNDLFKKISSGEYFYYMDSNKLDGFKLKYGVSGQETAMAKTTIQALDAKDNEIYAFYNDDAPKRSGKKVKIPAKDATPKETQGKKVKGGEKHAHSKGVLNFDENQGFWMMHSVPTFGDGDSSNRKKYRFSQNGFDYAQIFLCVTFESSQLSEIAAQMFISRFNVYNRSPEIPKAIAQKWPVLNDIFLYNPIDEDRLSTPFWRNARLRSKKGNVWFDSFEKFSHAEADLFVNQVARTYKEHFKVQTMLQSPSLKTNKKNYINECGYAYKTKNIRYLKSNEKIEGHEIEFKWLNTEDHAKWAISAGQTDKENPKRKIFCVGDLNRQTSQCTRGGGAMCFENAKVWEFFNRLAHKVQCCEGETRKTHGCASFNVKALSNAPKRSRNFYQDGTSTKNQCDNKIVNKEHFDKYLNKDKKDDEDVNSSDELEEEEQVDDGYESTEEGSEKETDEEGQGSDDNGKPHLKRPTEPKGSDLKRRGTNDEHGNPRWTRGKNNDEDNDDVMTDVPNQVLAYD